MVEDFQSVGPIGAAFLGNDLVLRPVHSTHRLCSEEAAVGRPYRRYQSDGRGATYLQIGSDTLPQRSEPFSNSYEADSTLVFSFGIEPDSVDNKKVSFTRLADFGYVTAFAWFGTLVRIP